MRKSLSFLMLISSLFASQSGLLAQEIEPCGTDAYHLEKLKNDADYRMGFYRAEALARKWMTEHPEKFKGNSEEKVVIPVVFHNVYKESLQNVQKLPYHKFVEQIEIMNRDFNLYNRNRSKIRPIFDSIAESVNIVFTLASVDPDGNPSNGVVYRSTNFSGFDLLPPNAQYTEIDSLKTTSGGGSDAWPTDRYFNIWVARLSYFGSDGLYGIATFPQNMPPAEVAGTTPKPDHLQGVALFYPTVGITRNAAGDTTFAGRTNTHEIGHYFGLRHIWGDSQSQQCDSSDYVFDTPQHRRNAGQTCNLTLNECSNEDPYWGSTNPPNMVENYMDYSGDGCYSMFTRGQASRMRGYLNAGREGLLENYAAGARKENQFKAWGYTDPSGSCPNSCEGKIELFAQNGTPPYSFVLDGNSSDEANFNNLCSGIHQAKVIDANGDSIVFDLYVAIGDYLKPKYTKSATSATCYSCPNGKAKVNITGGVQPITITWDVDPPVSGPELTGCSNGYYRFTVTDGCGESYTDSIKVGSPTGIEAISQSELKLFPNPASGLVTLSLEQPMEISKVQIINTLGSLCSETLLSGQIEEVEIDIRALPAGAYQIIMIDSGGGAKRLSLIKK